MTRDLTRDECQKMAMETLYAQAPSELSSCAASYITPGKRYLVLKEDGDSFTIDVGAPHNEIYCLWKECAHLDDDDWVRASATPPVVTQLETMLVMIRGKDFQRFDGDELDRAEGALTALLSEARENAHHEDRALHGDEVSA